MKSRLVISFDFELGWGVLEDQGWVEREKNGIYVEIRRKMPELMQVLESRDIASTWGVVGGMLQEEIRTSELEHLPNSYKQAVSKFLSHSDWHTRCGADLMEQLVKFGGELEVCSHSHTHIYARHPDVNEHQYQTDMEAANACIEAVTGERVESIIFPRDQAEFRITLAKRMPLNFRINPRFGSSRGKIGRIASGIKDGLGSVNESIIFVGPAGEVYQSGSVYFNWIGGAHEAVKRHLLKLQLRKLSREIRSNFGKTYHVWLHPFNLVQSFKVWELFMWWLEEISSLQEKGLLETVTMRRIGRECGTLSRGFSFE